ncbi:MAG: CGNR zinc finger domain-containing protein [Ilumatobacteraceae bacterium]
MTGQAVFDSYEYTGARVAVDLVNALAVDHVSGRPAPDGGQDAHVDAVRAALSVDPASLDRFRPSDAAAFAALGRRLRGIVDALAAGDIDGAAGDLNAMLAEHPAHPHLAKEGGRWRLHHHPDDDALIPMWTAICAEALARAIGEGHENRVGTCAGSECDRAFLDESKNARRRFCTTACQSRVKAAAYRARQRTP